MHKNNFKTKDYNNIPYSKQVSYRIHTSSPAIHGVSWKDTLLLYTHSSSAVYTQQVRIRYALNGINKC